MKIRYENVIDDFLVFNRRHFVRSSLGRRSQLTQFWFGVVGVSKVLYWSFVTASALVFVGGATVMILAILGFRGQPLRSLDRRVRRMYDEEANRFLFGPHELELGEAELITRNPAGESRLRYEAIMHVITDRVFTFIYVTPETAFVVPHGAVKEGEPDAFVEGLRGCLEPGRFERADTGTE